MNFIYAAVIFLSCRLQTIETLLPYVNIDGVNVLKTLVSSYIFLTEIGFESWNMY
jgi:hypothetical protein